MVKKCLKVLATIGFLFCFSFICVGYANLVDELVIEGTISAKESVIDKFIEGSEVTGNAGDIEAGVHIGHGGSERTASENTKRFSLYKTSDLDDDGLEDYFVIIDTVKLEPYLSYYNEKNKEYDVQVIGCAIPDFKDDGGSQLYMYSDGDDKWKTTSSFANLERFDYYLLSNETYYLFIYNVDFAIAKNNMTGTWILRTEEETITYLEGLKL